MRGIVVGMAVVAGVAALTPAAAVASPAKRAPAFQPALARTVETATVRASTEVFSTAGTRLPKGDRLASWSVSFDDSATRLGGTTNLPKTFSHKVTRGGTRLAVLSVTDTRGARRTASLHYSAAGRYVPPAPRLALRERKREDGQVLTFDVTPNTWFHLSATVSVDFGDGTVTTVREPRGHALVLRHTYAAPALHYAVTTTVTDGRHRRVVRHDRVDLSIGPMVSIGTTTAITGSPWTSSVGATLPPGQSRSFYRDYAASRLACSAPDAPVTVTHTLMAGGTVTATWSTPGPRIVTCSFVDDYGVLRTGSATVTVSLPSVQLRDVKTNTGSVGGRLGPAATFTLGTHTVRSWDLDFGDGSAHATGLGSYVQPTHPYSAPGDYVAVLAATLEDGEVITGTAHVSVTAPPSVFVTSAATTPPSTLELDGIVSTKSAAAAWASFDVFWGDGMLTALSGTTATTTSHTYAQPGTYTVYVDVLDDHGGEASDSFTVTVP